MAGIDNRLILILVMILLLISVMGVYAMMTNIYPAPESKPPCSETQGVVGVEILSDRPKSPPVQTSGIVGLVILGGNEE